MGQGLLFFSRFGHADGANERWSRHVEQLSGDGPPVCSVRKAWIDLPEGSG